LRVLVLFAHPVETSFGAALNVKVVEVLRAKGHEVDDCDLNAEGFDPVMSRQDRIDYHNAAVTVAMSALTWTVSWPPRRSCFRSRSGTWDFRRS
jgi:putative NADPH-quinone reductase